MVDQTSLEMRFWPVETRQRFGQKECVHHDLLCCECVTMVTRMRQLYLVYQVLGQLECFSQQLKHIGQPGHFGLHLA